MALIKEALLKVGNGESLEAISRELGVREATFRAMVEFMVEKGYLEEISGESNCMSCPIKCGAPPMNIKMYMLTKKGEEYTKERE